MKQVKIIKTLFNRQIINLMCIDHAKTLNIELKLDL